MKNINFDKSDKWLEYNDHLHIGEGYLKGDISLLFDDNLMDKLENVNKENSNVLNFLIIYQQLENLQLEWKTK